MSDYTINSGPWFEISNGQIISESNGAPLHLQSRPLAEIRANGWFPGLVVEGQRQIDELIHAGLTVSTELAGDVVRVAYTAIPRDLDGVKAVALRRINERAEAAYAVFDKDLIAVNRGRSLLPEKRAKIDAIAAAAAQARTAVQSAATIEQVTALFPLTFGSNAS